MKHLLLIFTFLGVAISSVPAQGRMDEKIQALKIAFITEKLQLTAGEAQQFWPVYNTYEKEIEDLRRNSKDGDVLENEEKLLSIRKKYRPSFEKILGPSKMNKLFLAEKEFRNILIKRLKNRKEKGGRF